MMSKKKTLRNYSQNMGKSLRSNSRKMDKVALDSLNFRILVMLQMLLKRIILNSKESALELRWERVEERKEMKVVSLVDLSTILLGNATRILAEMEEDLTIEEAEVDLTTGEEEVLAHMNVIEGEIITVIEEENLLEKIVIPTEETLHLTEDAAVLDQIQEIKAAANMKIKEEALINMNLPTMVSETEETKGDMSVSQETHHLQVISRNTTKEKQQIMANSVTVSPTVDRTITAPTPDTLHPAKRKIRQTNEQMNGERHEMIF